MKIKVDAAFASAKMPDGNRISFGDYTYQTKSLKEGEDYLRVDADVVFGELVIEER